MQKDTDWNPAGEEWKRGCWRGTFDADGADLLEA